MAKLTEVTATSGEQNAREQLLGGCAIEDRRKLQSVCQKTPEMRCFSVDATKAPESSYTLSTSLTSREYLLSVNATKRSCTVTECQRQKRQREGAECHATKDRGKELCRATKDRGKVRSIDAKKKYSSCQSVYATKQPKAMPSVKATKRPKTVVECVRHPAIATVVPTIRHQSLSL